MEIEFTYNFMGFDYPCKATVKGAKVQLRAGGYPSEPFEGELEVTYMEIAGPDGYDYSVDFESLYDHPLTRKPISIYDLIRAEAITQAVENPSE